jgi:hypothetical protein
MKEDIDNIFSKIQTLSWAFGKISKTYTVKDGMTTLDCFICEQLFQQPGGTNKKQIKKSITMSVLNHIYNRHFEEAFTAYRKKILKSFVKEVNDEEMVKEVR